MALGKDFLVLVLLQLKLFELQKMSHVVLTVSHPLDYQICDSLTTCVSEILRISNEVSAGKVNAAQHCACVAGQSLV